MFEKLICGQAIKITPENLELIAVVNKGVAPAYDPDSLRGDWFIMPDSPSLHNRILPGYVFEVNYAAWNPADYPLNDKYFVEIVEI